MRFYLDTEFNSHGGDLISLAIAGTDGKHWYGIFAPPLPMIVAPWVAEHVMPFLHSLPATVDGNQDGNAVVRASLHQYLASRAGNILYADWPDDFLHLMRLMSGPSYEQSWIVDIGMQLLAESEPRPEVPHNALSDAIALMHWHVASGGTT